MGYVRLSLDFPGREIPWIRGQVCATLPIAMRLLKKFLLSVWADFPTRMSGPATVPFALLALFMRGDAAKTVFGAMATVCGLTSAYRLWESEYRGRIGAEEALAGERAARTKPDVSVEFQEVYVQRKLLLDDPTRKENWRVTLKAYVVNKSPVPTTIKDYFLTFRPADDPFRALELHDFDHLRANRGAGLSDDLEFLKNSGLLEELPELAPKLASETLEHGVGVSGWLRFFLTWNKREPYALELTVVDAFGNSHSAISTKPWRSDVVVRYETDGGIRKESEASI
jgi:hypothetical protein